MSTDAEPDFAGWYAALWPRAVTAVSITVGDRDLAEEAVAEAFARALARWPKQAEMAAPVAWLHRVAVNEIRSRWRRRRTERRMLDRLAARSPETHPEPEPRDDAVWRAVSALPPRSREIVALRYVADLPEAEIAARLGISRGTVASTLSHSRRTLAEALAHLRQPVPLTIAKRITGETS